MNPVQPSEQLAPKPINFRASLGQVCFALLLLLSGFCGISYEVLYARLLSNFIGDQFAVSAAILLSFMLGLGIGTLWAHRLWAWLWLIEAGIGGFGALFALGLPFFESWRGSINFGAGYGLGQPMLICFALLSFPAVLIGCSLPLFAGYLSRLSTGRIFARAYMVYNCGAGLTVLAIEFWLLRQWGLRQTILSIAALNGVTALALRFGFSWLRAMPEASVPGWLIPKRACLALAIASIASAIFQLLMVKIAECLLGPFRETFALVLAVVLFGIAAGSGLARRWRLQFSWVLVAGLAGLAWLLAGYEWVTRGYAYLYPMASRHAFSLLLLKGTVLAILMGLPGLAFGATIPALVGEIGQVARQSGRLLGISSLANALGFLLMSLVLHRALDYGVILLVVAGLVVLSIVVHGSRRGLAPAAAAALGLLAIFSHQTRWNEKLLYITYDYFTSVSEMNHAKKMLTSIQSFKGAQDVFSLNHFGNDIHFFINGYVSMSLSSPWEKIVGAFPALFSPRTDRALVLGTGSGATAGAVARLFQRLDTVEINPVVLENLWRMDPYNFDLASQPNTRFIVDDAIHYIKVCPARYPLIINTVTSPRYFSSSKLYTVDFLNDVQKNLTPDGLYVTWADGRLGPRGLDIILQTVRHCFKECSLVGIRSGYYLLLCSQHPIQLRQPNLVASNAVLASYFRTNGLQPDWLAYGLLIPRAYDLIRNPQAPLNTLDYPALEFEIARFYDENREAGVFYAKLVEKLDLDQLARAFSPALNFNPLHFALHGERLFRESDILDRSVKLAAKTMEDFRPQFRQAKLEHYSNWVALANSSKAHHYYAEELLAQRKYEEAIAAESKALALDPAIDDALYNIAVAYEKLGRLDLAETNYLKEWKMDPRDRKILLGLAQVHFKRKDYPKALECLQRALAEKDRAEIHLRLSQVLEEMGRNTEAEAEYQGFLKFRPDNTPR